MSGLRPECGISSQPAMPNDTALFLIRDSVAKRGGLIHGRLRDNGGRCAIGAFWEDNPRVTLNSSLVDEVAAVNDSLGPKATPKQRWKKVNEWLRWKIRSMAVSRARV
jgi:hypothetical protein